MQKYISLFFFKYYLCCIINAISINQDSFDRVKVGPAPVLALHKLWQQIHMFTDILEFRVENKKNNLENNALVMGTQICRKMA